MLGGIAELIISLVAMLIILASFLPIQDRLFDTQRAAIAASEIANIRDAASQYISNNWSAVYSKAATPSLITVTELQDAGYLIGTGMNPWQQNHAVLISRSGSTGILGIVVSYGGNQIPANRIQIAAGLIGKYAAYVPYATDTSPCILPCVKGIGQYWSQSLAGFNTGITAAYVPTSGHLAAGIFFPSQGLMQDGVGEIVFFASSTAPSGYLKADGSAVSRIEYAALFSVIGTTFGAGDGGTTFNLPDLRGEFIRGFDNGRGIDSGRALGTTQGDAFQLHQHSSAADTLEGSGYYGAMLPTGASNWPRAPTHYYLDDGGGPPRTASETRPRNIALLACIKY